MALIIQAISIFMVNVAAARIQQENVHSGVFPIDPGSSIVVHNLPSTVVIVKGMPFKLEDALGVLLVDQCDVPPCERNDNGRHHDTLWDVFTPRMFWIKCFPMDGAAVSRVYSMGVTPP